MGAGVEGIGHPESSEGRAGGRQCWPLYEEVPGQCFPWASHSRGRAGLSRSGEQPGWWASPSVGAHSACLCLLRLWFLVGSQLAQTCSEGGGTAV